MKGIAFLSGLLGVLITFGNLPLKAQVNSDGTTNTTVNLNNNNFNILNGIQKGNNLFHSFKEFSIPTGSSVNFDNSTDVVNIINRVTGGNISNIDGLIKANGSANLFLINPAGIVFGENAKLDIGGSFLGTTAESILFEDGFEFSTLNPQAEPLLTVSVPLGLQFNQNPGDITVNNNGHSLIAASPIERIIPPGLEVKSGNNLAFIGRNIFLNGGFIGANGGYVELGAVGSNESGSSIKLNVSPDNWEFDYGENINLGEIKLKQKSFIDSSGNDSGSINLVGKNISIEDGSTVLIQTQNSTGNNLDTNSIDIKASETFTIDGTIEDGEFLSNITSEILGSKKGTDILIAAKNLFVKEDGQIETKSFGTGNAANITINVIESTNIKGDSSIASIGFGSGDAGVINLTTENLSIVDGGTINSTSLAGSGNSGDVTINARNSVQVIGFLADNNLFSVIGSSTITEGNGGNLTINTGKLLLQKGGRIDASAFSSGNAGNVVINASEFVEINGEVEEEINPSLIIASANVLPENIRARFGLPDKPSGDSGSVTVNTPELRITDGGSVTVQNDGIGKGGTLEINGDRVLLNRGSSISASTLSGQGGNITINLGEKLFLRQEGSISAQASGTGNGGNLTIKSPVILGLENSDIIANAVEGNGGNINIETQGLFGLEFSDELTSAPDITASSEFGINGEIEINSIKINPSFALVELPSTIKDSTKLEAGCGANGNNKFSVLGRGGLPQNPNELFSTSTIKVNLIDLVDEGKIQSNNSSGSNIINYDNPKKSIVEATGFIRNAKGEIEFVAVGSIPFKTKQIAECSGKYT